MMGRTGIVVGQIRGAEYAALEIVWWMAASLLAGFLIGWIVRDARAGRRVAAEYQERLETAETARREAEAQRKEAEGHLVAAVGDLEASRSELAAARTRIEELEAAHASETVSDVADHDHEPPAGEDVGEAVLGPAAAAILPEAGKDEPSRPAEEPAVAVDSEES